MKLENDGVNLIRKEQQLPYKLKDEKEKKQRVQKRLVTRNEAESNGRNR